MSANTNTSPFDLSGRTALVTGGSRNLGLQMAKALGKQGARIVISARKIEELEAATAELTGMGIEANWIAADSSKESDITKLSEEALKLAGRVDILINNAGNTWGAPAEDYPTDGWDRVFNLNVRGQFILTRNIAKQSMIPARYGRVINIASVGGLQGTMPDVMRAIAYNSSKGALINFTRALAAEWGHYGITVNALAPGFFPSNLTNGLIDAVGNERMTANVPVGRLGGDEDLIGPVLMFAAESSRYVTGQVLAVDGGASIV
ncbi:SDR family oxidoreductase [Nevskia ramosa]|uniref:SDR family oxidoreductase n=1 Tax=Nevskia ramosa TaxID=64002 RepID=UPI0003B47291|nr:SDR family oxidoreductase [Nevskia ramosa]